MERNSESPGIRIIETIQVEIMPQAPLLFFKIIFILRSSVSWHKAFFITSFFSKKCRNILKGVLDEKFQQKYEQMLCLFILAPIGNLIQVHIVFFGQL